MDLSSILPLLMNNGANGDKTQQMASLLSSMNGNSNQNKQSNNQGSNSTYSGSNQEATSQPNKTANNSGNNIANMANILSAMNGGGGKGLDSQAIMSLLANKNGSGGANGGMDIASILSMANKTKQPKKSPAEGVKPIKDIATNDIVGIIVKYMTK